MNAVPKRQSAKSNAGAEGLLTVGTGQPILTWGLGLYCPFHTLRCLLFGTHHRSHRETGSLDLSKRLASGAARSATCRGQWHAYLQQTEILLSPTFCWLGCPCSGWLEFSRRGGDYPPRFLSMAHGSSIPLAITRLQGHAPSPWPLSDLQL
jgi:hypothetical protein